jgi:hypothetical protein
VIVSWKGKMIPTQLSAVFHCLVQDGFTFHVFFSIRISLSFECPCLESAFGLEAEPLDS